MAETNDTHQGEKPWFDGFDDETKGYLQARGLDKKTVTEAVAETIKAHRNAESKLGMPADQVFRWPAADDAAGMKTVFDKLGVPADPSGYDFSGVKNADEAFIALMRTTAHELHLPASAAPALAERIVKYGLDQKNVEQQREAVKVQMQKDQLKANWGAAHDTNEFIAMRARELIGLSAEALNAMANTAGYTAVMEGLLKIGKAMGEQKLLGIHEPGTGSNRTLTAEEAISKKAELMSDRDFIKRWGEGNKEAITELDNLNKIIVAAHHQGYQVPRV